MNINKNNSIFYFYILSLGETSAEYGISNTELISVDRAEEEG